MHVSHVPSVVGVSTGICIRYNMLKLNTEIWKHTYPCVQYETQYGNILLYLIWNPIWKHILVSDMESNVETYSCIRYGTQYGNIFLYLILLYTAIYKTSYPRKLLLWKWNSGEQLEGMLKTVVICAL